MNFVNTLKNHKLFFTISLTLMLLVSTSLTTNSPKTLTDKSSREDYDQFQSKFYPSKSTYYEDTIGFALSVWVEGDYAYIADQTSGLAVIDISLHR
jgi:hypothetical protein